MTVEVLPGAGRHRWDDTWLTSMQSFPATGNFDLEAGAHGVLMVHNEDIVDAGGGFDTHRHRDVEIVTWVLEGSIEHRDSDGNCGLITPGLVQRMSAGRGITHSERNASTRRDNVAAHVVQMWLPPDADGRDPGYAERDFTDALASGRLVTVVSGRAAHRDTDALSIGNRFVALHIARPRAGMTIELPPAPFGHLFVARGQIEVVGESATPLEVGDAVRSVDKPAMTVRAVTDAEILLWEMHASFDL
ncbi:pirin family protein [Williamsia sp. MIQD14]|uniref:pirin family protein n=1 Tax=Williamsia sp. MIQD14 TaxID=3425703 RepID=UPI003DA19C05